MPAKKYISKIVKGNDDIYIKDVEARDNLQYKDVYIGVGADYADAMIAANHHDTVLKGALISVTASSTYLWVILPTAYSPIVQMGGLNVPMTEQSNVTVSDVTYKVLKSSNQYTGTFSISLV